MRTPLQPRPFRPGYGWRPLLGRVVGADRSSQFYKANHDMGSGGAPGCGYDIYGASWLVLGEPIPATRLHVRKHAGRPRAWRCCDTRRRSRAPKAGRRHYLPAAILTADTSATTICRRRHYIVSANQETRSAWR